MASLTDMIFLLLIFFVLTSKMVKPVSFDLPESDSKTVAPASVVVEIGEDGKLVLDGKQQNISSLKRAIRDLKTETGSSKDFTVTIAAFADTPYERVVELIQMAGELRVKAILATKPFDKGQG